jgi:hypothetical protein
VPVFCSHQCVGKAHDADESAGEEASHGDDHRRLLQVATNASEHSSGKSAGGAHEAHHADAHGEEHANEQATHALTVGDLQELRTPAMGGALRYHA